MSLIRVIPCNDASFKTREERNCSGHCFPVPTCKWHSVMNLPRHYGACGDSKHKGIPKTQECFCITVACVSSDLTLPGRSGALTTLAGMPIRVLEDPLCIGLHSLRQPSRNKSNFPWFSTSPYQSVLSQKNDKTILGLNSAIKISMKVLDGVVYVCLLRFAPSRLLSSHAKRIITVLWILLLSFFILSKHFWTKCSQWHITRASLPSLPSSPSSYSSLVLASGCCSLGLLALALTLLASPSRTFTGLLSPWCLKALLSLYVPRTSVV